MTANVLLLIQEINLNREKVMRDKYLTGICGEIILGEGDKCEKSEDRKAIYYNV